MSVEFIILCIAGIVIFMSLYRLATILDRVFYAICSPFKIFFPARPRFKAHKTSWQRDEIELIKLRRDAAAKADRAEKAKVAKAKYSETFKRFSPPDVTL